jgi:hypothetical protein
MIGHTVSRRLFVGGALAALVAPATARGEVRVNIGINLPGPPQLVPVPAAPSIAYAPGVGANYFSYDGEYWVFDSGNWYMSRGYNGPWVVVAPEFVPRPLLGVPVQFYRQPPVAWRRWRREQAPRWQARYGRRWEERRHEGQALPRERGEERRDDHGRDDHERREDHREGRGRGGRDERR